MSKDISLTNDGTITLRGSGTPQEGGNLNNHIAFSVNPSSKRVGLSTGLGATMASDVGGGIKLIGSTGFAIKASGNVGIGADQAERQHDSKYDVPLRSNAIGFREGRQLANEIVGLKGGDIRKYTVGETEGIINNHPNLLKPESLARLRENMGKLEDINTGRVLTPEVKGRIEDIAGQLRDRGISIPTDAITSAGSISAADLLRQQTLTRVNGAAESVQGAIASAGGVDYINTSIANAAARLQEPVPSIGGIDRINTAIGDAATRLQGSVPSGGNADRINAAIGDAATRLQGAVTAGGDRINTAIADAAARLPNTQHAVQVLQETVSDTSATADNIARQYQNIPTVEEVRKIQRQIDTMVRHDPALDVSAFAALGAKSADAGAALVVQRAAHASVGNIDWIAGTGAKLHKANISSTRLEAGVGEGALSFSPDTARKLNLTVSGAQTAVGGYAYVDKEKVNWSGLDGSRKTTTIGVGASISKGIGGGNTGIVSVEAFDSRVHQVGPGNIPGKERDKGVAVKGQITF